MFIFFLPWPLVAEEKDYVRAKVLLQEGKILPLTTIIEQIETIHPGRILEVKLTEKKSVLVYEVELLDKDGMVWEYYLNAATGKIVIKEKEE